MEVKLESNTLIVSETDEKGRIIYANEDFCTIAGYTKDELIGKAHNIVRHQDMPKWAFQNLWDTLKEGKVWHGVVKNATKDGGFYWVYATIYPAKTKDGQLRYISVRVKPTETEIQNAKKIMGI